jgi:hypothetical protein
VTIRQLLGSARTDIRSVEDLQRTLDGLSAERQRLRADSAEPEVLEQNRHEIMATQWELSYALIARYLPQAA